ncbi:MAG: dihydrofolate reductase [Fibrobacteria bacterium]|nr:dihydrofolate reductase [Fibrobacteria bacterium]
MENDGRCPLHVHAFLALSLDGFIARKDGGLDWLPTENVPGEDLGFESFLSGVDVLLMGRRTFQTVLGFGQWPYGALPARIVTSSMESRDIPTWIPGNVELTRKSPVDVLTDLGREGFDSVYADGGLLVRSLLVAGRLDDLVLTRIPILLGDGIPLFGPLDQDIPLAHVETRSFPSGLVQSKYSRSTRNLPRT